MIWNASNYPFFKRFMTWNARPFSFGMQLMILDIDDKMEPGYFSLVATAMKLQQILISLHIFSTYIRTVVPCAKTAISLQWKRLCVPVCTCIERRLIDFIKVSMYNTSPMETILYQLKKRCGGVMETRMPPGHAANLVRNIDNVIYGLEYG